MDELDELLEGFDQARLLTIKRRLGLPDDDPIWVYLAGLEYYQRLFEAVPRQIRESSDAERQRLQAETSQIIARAECTINEAAAGAASVAHDAARRLPRLG